ncbi:MAG: hypothetical protein IJI01_00305 [Butyrivibrio sp.]|nr:hypothetical protein [Butyrivibrio sp.]MBQ6587099.1 hypothetical protein [Butyrivibrio sp.]
MKAWANPSIESLDFTATANGRDNGKIEEVILITQGGGEYYSEGVERKS